MCLLKNKIGKRIRQLRKLKGWTQGDLGVRADMEYQYLGAIERGEKNPTLDFIEKIAIGLEVEPHQLFIFSDEEQEEKEKIIDDKIKDMLCFCNAETKQSLLAIIQNILQLRNTNEKS